MIRRTFKFLLLLIPLWTISPMVSAQDGVSRKQQEKIQAKKAREEKKELKKKEREGRKRHLDIQDKQARKRIKKHTKRAERRGTLTHKDGFFSRLFRRKR